MMLLAITALLSFPFVISQRFSKSRMTITRNLFSCQAYIKDYKDKHVKIHYGKSEIKHIELSEKAQNKSKISRGNESSASGGGD